MGLKDLSVSFQSAYGGFLLEQRKAVSWINSKTAHIYDERLGGNSV